jgi:release factor glutamine methyltransferase
MNDILTDNSVATLESYLLKELAPIMEPREASGVVAILFDAYKNWSRADVVMNKTSSLHESDLLKFHFALKRLKKGEPIQYVTGITWFYGMPFQVNPSVLIPRPETEELVREILNRKGRETKLNVLDIGTGSGCIAIALKKNLVNAIVLACDKSEDALAVCAANAIANNVQVELLQVDILQQNSFKVKYDIIVSNPPYITQSEKSDMDTRVKDHEPSLALFVPDEDPLLFYRRIVMLSKEILQPGGLLAFEIHKDYGLQMLQLMEENSFENVELIKDMQELDRIIMATSAV